MDDDLRKVILSTILISSGVFSFMTAILLIALQGLAEVTSLIILILLGLTLVLIGIMFRYRIKES